MYTNREYLDMILLLGEHVGNTEAAAREYAERYPNRRHPCGRTIRRLEDRLLATGQFEPLTPDRGRPRGVRVDAVENVLDLVNENPRISTREIEGITGVCHSSVNRILLEEHFHPFHFTKTQALIEEDFHVRVNFSNWLLNVLERDPTFTKKVLWQDEAIFSRSGYFNQHNMHFYSVENPHVNHESSHQHRFSVNVWAGIIGNRLLGPVFLPNRLNGEGFLDFLSNTLEDMLDDLPLAERRDMWLQLDGAPPHFHAGVRQWINEHFPNNWIGRGGVVNWPARSPDMIPLDFFLWGHVKSSVYRTPVENEDVLRGRIRQAFRDVTPLILENVHNNIRRRAQACLDAQGRNFEQFL